MSKNWMFFAALSLFFYASGTSAQEGIAYPRSLQGYALLGETDSSLVWFKYAKSPCISQRIAFCLTDRSWQIQKKYALEGFPKNLRLREDSLLRFVNRDSFLLAVISSVNDPDQARTKRFPVPWPANEDAVFRANSSSKTGDMAWYKHERLKSRPLQGVHWLWMADDELQLFQNELYLSKSFPRIGRMIEPPLINLSSRNDLVLTYPWNAAIYHFRYGPGQLFAQGEHYLYREKNRMERARSRTAIRGQQFLYSSLIKTFDGDSLLAFQKQLRNGTESMSQWRITEILKKANFPTGNTIPEFDLLEATWDQKGEAILLLGTKGIDSKYDGLLVVRINQKCNLKDAVFVPTTSFEPKNMQVLKLPGVEQFQVLLTVPVPGQKKNGWTLLSFLDIEYQIHPINVQRTRGKKSGLDHPVVYYFKDLSGQQTVVTAPTRKKRAATYELKQP